MGRENTNNHLWAYTVINRVDDTALVVFYYSIPYFDADLSDEIRHSLHENAHA